MPPAVLLVLPLDGMSLWVTVCFLGVLDTRGFLGRFWLDEKEILSVNSDVNKSNNLWWIKISLP